MSERRRKQKEQIDHQVKSARKKSRRRHFIFMQFIILFLILCGIGYVSYDRIMDSKTMGCRISISGENVSWKTVDEAAVILEDAFAERNVVFKENGKDIYAVTLRDAGYSINDQQLKTALEEVKANRTPCLVLFEKKKDMDITYQIDQDDEKIASAFAVSHFDTAARSASEDAYISYNKDQKQFTIVNSVYGNEIAQDVILAKTKEAIAQGIASSALSGDVSVEVSADVYIKPEILEDGNDLTKELADLNAVLANYEKASVTYTFGDTTEVLDSDTVKSWLVVNGSSVSLDEDAMKEYIYNLGTSYNTMYEPRVLQTSGGGEVTIDNNEYGYLIDQDAEYEQLYKDLKSGEAVTREPVYANTGYGRNGNDDIQGNYIEVSLTEQHLWLYVNGELITDTAVVTGQPVGINKKTGEQEDWSTYQGAYPIAYKEHPSTLSSDIYGYEVDVQYWMPFVLGQGLHDASWRGSFGGDIYQTDGSHGCVNLPSDQAAAIFDYVDTGFPVLIY